ncbi:MAG: hypothetical protein LBB13_02155 [Rickettsiales bacterium]|jgi:hypothetical protein|nr:hypothetical protein [Rickettsiales bacterium]
MIKRIRKNVSGLKKCTLAAIAVFSAWLVLYSVQLLCVKNKIREQLDRQTTGYTLEHGKIVVKFLSPLRISVAVKDLQLSFSGSPFPRGASAEKQTKGFKIFSDNTLIFSPLLSKKLDIYIPDGFLFEDSQQNILVRPVNYFIRIIAGTNSSLDRAKITAETIQTRKPTDSDSEFFDSMKNFSLTVSNDDKTKNHTNTTIKLNIDFINSKVEKGVLESNFELVISSIKDFDKNGNVASIEIAVDKSNFNDITNNFGLDVNGSYMVSARTRSGKADFEFRVINFRSLISSLNRADSEFPVFGKKSLGDIVQLLELIPANPKDTKYDRYYRLSSDIVSKTATINGIDINNFMQGLINNGGGGKR